MKREPIPCKTLAQNVEAKRIKEVFFAEAFAGQHALEFLLQHLVRFVLVSVLFPEGLADQIIHSSEEQLENI
jgi:hypothetical protein